MEARWGKFPRWLLLLLLAPLPLPAESGGDREGRQAFVSLLYGNEFLLGVRVLGQSLAESGTTR
jgi:hypothetical protein